MKCKTKYIETKQESLSIRGTPPTHPVPERKGGGMMACSHCTEGAPEMGMGCTVHIAAGAGPGMGLGNIMPSCLHVLETTLFQPCAHVLIILQ